MQVLSVAWNTVEHNQNTSENSAQCFTPPSPKVSPGGGPKPQNAVLALLAKQAWWIETWQADLPEASSSKRVESARAGRAPRHLCCSCIRPWGAAMSSGLGLHPPWQMDVLRNSRIHSVFLLASHLHHKLQHREHPPVDASYLPSFLAVFPTCVLLCLCSPSISFPVMSFSALQFFLM